MMARIFGIDLRSLAFFRILLGVALLANLINLWPHSEAFFSDHGILTRAEAFIANAPTRWSLFFATGLPWLVKLALLIPIGAAFALLVGYFTRAATVVSWLFAVSLINRNVMIIQGGDQLLVLLLFWAMFLPLGAIWSVDAALAANREEEPPSKALLTVATAAILLQALYVYFIGALLKVSPRWIPDATAVYYAVSLDSFATPLGHWLRDQLWLTKPLTYFVWGLELAAPVFLLSPWLRVPLRLVGLALLVLMHIGFALFLTIGLFPLISIASLSLFVPGAAWDWLAAKLYPPERRGIALYYDRGCSFCEKTCLLLKTFCLAHDTRVMPAQDDPAIGPILEAETSWVVTDRDGRIHLKWAALAFVLRQSPLFRPLGWLIDRPKLRPLGDRLYDWIGRKRDLWGHLSARWLPRRPIKYRLSALGAAAATLAAVLVAIWNIRSLPAVGFDLPGPVRTVASALRLDQHWNMFAPFPLTSDGWYVVEGAFTDRSPIDLWTGEVGFVEHARPDYPAGWYGDYRWRKYFTRITEQRHRRQLHNFARYYCRQYNRYGSWPLELETIRITFYRERTPLPGEARETEPIRLLSWNCLI